MRVSVYESSMSQKRPNILFVLLDDLGYSDLGCYGGEINTPNIDALARGGVRFEGMYNSARCCPSRASLMTGLYPPQTGIADFVSREPHPTKGPAHLGRLRDDCVSLAEVLKPNGYSCYFSGKWHMHEATGPIDRGFDEFFGYTMDHSHDQYDSDYYQRLPDGRQKEIHRSRDKFYATDVFNEYALQFIKQGRRAGQPWLLYLSHSSPHFPLQAPAADADRYFDTYMRGWDVLREERYRRMGEIDLIDDQNWSLTERSMVPVDQDDIANGFSGRQSPAWASLDTDRQQDLARRMSVYAAMVEAVDRGIGRIVEHLEATDELKNTLIMITSDNGACYEWGPFGFDEASRKGVTHLHAGPELQKMGERGTYHSYGSGWANLCNTPFRMYKHFTHEGGICAPLIVHWPDYYHGLGEWIRGSAHTTDIMPTMRAASGAAYPTHYRGTEIPPEEGISLLPALKGKAITGRTLFFSHQQSRAVIQDNWKIVWGKRTKTPLKWELYNLSEDRCEERDLAEKYPGRVSAMAAQWETYRIRVGLEDFEPWEIPEIEGISD